MQHLVEAVRRQVSTPNLIAVGLLWVTVIGSVLVSYRASGLPRTWRGFWFHVLPPGTLSHPSARADILFYITRKLVNFAFFTPMVLSAIGIGKAVNGLLSAVLPVHPATQPLSTGGLIGFTASMFVAYDFSYYVYHNAQHRIPVLWEIHKVHHSAEVMVGVTKDRVHPIDDFMNHVWDGIVTGVVYGVWLFFGTDPVELTIFGLNVYVLRNLLMLDFTRHTHYKISFGWLLDQIVICPHYHQLHHSIAPQHWDKNFGLMLTIWDRLFGTLVVPERNEDFVFGLTAEEHRDYRGCWRLYSQPIVKIYRMAAHRLASERKVESVHDSI